MLCPSLARAQLQVLPDTEPQRVFAGEGRKLAVVFHNPGAGTAEADLNLQICQASSATAVLATNLPWKKLTVLPGQTVLESATLSFPSIKAETRFVVRWLEGTNKVIGITDVFVYSPDLLKELRPLLGEEPLGAFDPQNQLKPLLKAAKVETEDLEDTGLENYRGKLAVIGPFQSRAQMRESLANRSVKALAQRGAAVVWIQPPPEEKRPTLKPSFYTVPEGRGTVVVVQATLLSDLPADPRAQLHLIALCKMALAPEPPRLPQVTINDNQ